MDIAKEFIVIGTVQSTGFRAYSTRIGRELHLKGTVENIEDGTVKVRCKGDSKDVDAFIAKIKELKLNTVKGASVINVKDVPENRIKTLKLNQIKEPIFKEKYGKMNAELAQGFQTGQKYIEKMRSDTMDRFDKMDEKYKAISEGMMTIVEVMNKRIDSFEKVSRKQNEHIDKMLEIFSKK